MQYPANSRRCARWLIVCIGLLLSGCESLQYYWQASSGHLSLMRQRQSIDALLQGDSLTASERGKLLQVVAIRDYAADVLALPVEGNYQHLVELEGQYVSWNVFAAEALSMQALQWCFPVAGCVSYRGYFKEQAARDYAQQLQQQGYDVYVGGVPAYSTLGWFADPVLDSFLRYDDIRLAALLFHELAHQVVYVKGDTSFNESFASAVEQLAVAQWLRDSGREQELAAWSRHDAWVETFSAWLKMHRENLQAIYQSDIDDHHKRKQKQAYLASMQQLYHDFRQQHQGDSSFDRWMQQPLNNARLLSIGSYNDWVVAFRHLMGQQACRWPAFYRAAEDLAALQPEQRTQALQTLQREHSYGDCSQRDADVVQKDW
jgi:predicted aminopeptidase